jgi:hypothetical protein
LPVAEAGVAVRHVRILTITEAGLAVAVLDFLPLGLAASLMAAARLGRLVR